METLYVLFAGIGIGVIAAYAFVIRPLTNTIRDMRFQGFVHDNPLPPRKTLPDSMERSVERNET